MHGLTGKDYGLPRARGHAPQPPAPAPEPVVLTPRRAAPQPWVPRPPRARLADRTMAEDEDDESRTPSSPKRAA